VCNLPKKQWKTWKKAHYLDLRMEKSNTKLKIWTPWTLIFVPVDQDVAGSTPVSHPRKKNSSLGVLLSIFQRIKLL
jgi:hypothetical protein